MSKLDLNKLQRAALARAAKVATRSNTPTPEPTPDYFKVVAHPGADELPRYVRLDKLNLDLRYQYDPETEKGRTNQLNKWMMDRGGFDPTERGAIHVNIRPDGTHWNMDGGGGAQMATLAGLDRILAFIHHFKTWQEEAAFFHRKNNHTRRVKAPHLFLTAANSGAQPEKTIVKLVEAAGYQLERTVGSKGAIIAASALLFGWYLDGTGHNLELSLLDMRNTVGDEKGVDGRFLVSNCMMRALGAEQKRLRTSLQYEPRETREPVKKSVEQTLHEARQNAQAVITSRSAQSRDTNPYLFRLHTARYNYRKGTTGGKSSLRIDPRNVALLRERFDTPELVARYGATTLYKDVWTWRD
jgi:hypothetical protein